MPLALLLEDVLATFRAIVSRDHGLALLASLGELAVIDDRLLGRSRSAYLVRWFGADLPYVHLGLAMHIDNIAALRRRYKTVLAQVAGDATGVNLLEPLAGLAGAALGTLLSPAGVLALSIGVFRRLGIVIGLLAGPMVAGLVGAVLGIVAPFAFAGALHVVLNGPPALRAIHGLLGAAAEFVVPFTKLLDQLTGPRAQVKNPLVRHLLEVFDRVAAVFAQAIGLVAVVLVRFVPKLAPLATQVAPLLALAGHVRDILVDVFADVTTQLTSLVIAETSPLQVVVRLFTGVRALVSAPVARLRALFTRIAAVLRGTRAELSAGFKLNATAWRDRVRAMLRAAPLGRLVEAVRGLGAIEWPPAPPKKKPPAGPPGRIEKFLRSQIPAMPKFRAPDTARIVRSAGGLPAFPVWEASTADLFAPYSRKAHAAAAAKARPLIDAVARPPRLFVPPALDIAAFAARDHALRGRLETVIERVLPPMFRKHLPAMLELFARLDKELYASDAARLRPAAPAPRPAFPTLDVDDTEVVVPVIRKLRVSVRGADTPDVRSFRDKLDAALRGHSYPVAEAR